MDSLNWRDRFVEETPGDSISGGGPRQVPGACWSNVKPSAVPDPFSDYGRMNWLRP